MLHSAEHTRPQLRRALRQLRRSLSPAEQRRAAAGLHRILVRRSLFLRARRAALYLASDGEIDPVALRHDLHKRGRQVYLPVLSRWPRCHMRFQRVDAGERLRPNRYGIPEPVADRKRQLPVWALDLVLLPLVGFDAQGNRLGMGGGFYDRALSYAARRRHWTGPLLLGLAHDCQQVDTLPVCDWDVPLAATVTATRWLTARVQRDCEISR